MRRAVLGLMGLHLLAATGCGEQAPDLRERIAAAGVYSPRRAQFGNEALVELGRLLFFDPELSGNRDVACSSCHLPFLHAGDGLRLGLGQDGTSLPRNTIEPFNRSFARTMFWDGRIEQREDGTIVAPEALPAGIETVLEAQALFPLLEPNEMLGRAGDVAADGRPNELALLETPEEIWAAVLARVLALDAYRSAFSAAFPGLALEEITIVHVARAIAALEMHLWELTDTAFDAFIGSVSTRPQDEALTAEQHAGAALFFGDAGCWRCHDGPLLTDEGFHNIGVPQIGLDEGRYEVTGAGADRFAFRTPSLRNVSMTGPFMHDGAYDTLDAAVRHHLDPEGSLRNYDSSRLPPELRDRLVRDEATLGALSDTISPDVAPLRPLHESEIADLVSFLDALASVTELEVFPEAGVPLEVPSGLPPGSPLTR